MSRASRIPNLGGAKAFILHRPHATVNALSRQLAAIGLDVRDCWPELPPDALAADFVFFDVDLGFDEQVNRILALARPLFAPGSAR